jgi:hypothetical protein
VEAKKEVEIAVTIACILHIYTTWRTATGRYECECQWAVGLEHLHLFFLAKKKQLSDVRVTTVVVVLVRVVATVAAPNGRSGGSGGASDDSG